MSNPRMPSTSTENRFCDAYKSTFLKQVYNREGRRFDGGKLALNSHHMQRRVRRLQLLPSGDVVARPRTSGSISPVKKHPTTADLCRPVGIDGYRRTLMISTPQASPVVLPKETLTPHGSNEAFTNMLERRDLLEFELAQVRANLSAEEEAVSPMLERMARSQSLRTTLGSVRGSARRSARSSARSSARGSARGLGDGAAGASARAGALASVRSSRLRSSRSGAPATGRYLGSGRVGSARGGARGSARRVRTQRGTGRPGTAMSFSSLSPTFTWDDAFNTSYADQYQRPSDATLRRNLLSVKQGMSAKSRKLSVARHVSADAEAEENPALAVLAATSTLRSLG